MLYIYFSYYDDFDDVLTEDNYRIQPTLWFRNQDGASYIKSSTEYKIIETIDNGKVISNNSIDFPFDGIMSAEELSGTAKTLILAANEPGIYVNGNFIGKKGYGILLSLAEQKDIYLHATALMAFDTDFDAYIVNDNSVIHTYKEFLEKGVEFIYGRST